MGTQLDGLEAYIDEERALGFHVWVAELELLVGTAKGRSIVQVAAFELLQKVLVTTETTDVGRVREYQRRCELALVEILLKGAAPPVRRLLCSCMAQLYAVGDTLPMYSRVSGFLSLLSGKESKTLSESTRVGALQCLAALCEKHGRVLASSITEMLAIALKFTGKSVEPAVRTAALELVAQVVAGLGPGDRSSLAVQSDALKCAIRIAKESEPASSALRVAAARVLQAIAQAEGAAFWSNLHAYEETVKLCIAMLEGPHHSAADAFAGALGDIAAARESQTAKDAVKALEKKAAKQAALSQVLKDAFNNCLVIPFVEAAGQGKWVSCTALTQSWLAYLNHSQTGETGDDSHLVELAARALEMLASISGSYLSGAMVEEGEPDVGFPLSGGELPRVQACVLYILRVGIIERLGEMGQRALLGRLTALLASVIGAQVPLAVAALEAMGQLLEVLGELSPEQLASIEEPVISKLVSGSSCVRRQAAGLLAAAAIGEPAGAARLLEQRLDRLEQCAAKAAQACGPEPPTASQVQGTSQDSQLPGPGTPRGLYASESSTLKPVMDAVHGNALGSAALLVATASLPLGVPSRLPMKALLLAERLIEQPASKRAIGRAVEREAGYILLGALCTSLTPAGLLERKQTLVQLWQPALAAESVADLDLRKYLTISQTKAELSMSMELWWRAAALEALKALVLSPLVSSEGAEAVKLQRRLAAILQPALAAVLASPVLQDPQKAKGIIGGAAALFQLRLLEVYLALPYPNAFASEHQAISKLCTRAFRGSSQPVGQQTAPSSGVAPSAANSTLCTLLNRQDAPLGPWIAGRGVLEDALQAFAGMPGGPLQHPWVASIPLGPRHSGDSAASPTQHEPFPQPKSLGAALLERQLVLLGRLLATVSEVNQVQILDVLTAAAAGPPTKRRESPIRRQAVLTSVCCTALAGLDSLARKYKGEVESRDAVAERARMLAEAALSEGAALSNAALLRSSAEMYALAACIGSDANAIRLLRNLCTSMAATSAPARRAALALALGCVYRSKGGIALQGTVGQAAETLLAVAKGSSGATHIWLLHALWLLANAAGLAFMPHVKGTLAMEMDLLMSEESAMVPGLRPALARLSNALVAVLGPELTLGSLAYSKTRAILQDLQDLGSKASSAEEATMSELERVLYAQMLILFAPQAVPAVAHLPLLLATLKSRQPALRRAAADTLRHLAERDPEAILPPRIEPTLFWALDSETDTGTAAQLKATLKTLLAAGAPSRPSHYLAVCSSVILAAAAPTVLGPGGTSNDVEALREEESSDEEAGVQQTEARRSSNSAALTSGRPTDGSDRAATRLRTRAFAAHCLLDLPDLVGSDRRHLDPIVAQETTTGDWLVSQLQTLIDVAFRMATGNVEVLRPAGLKLLQAILRHFSGAPDPLLEGSRLLEQSQAQFVAALRSALASQAAPSLAATGAALAVDYVKSGLTHCDSAILARLMSMLVEPLIAMEGSKQDHYAEWVGVQATVALLEANAVCMVHLLSRAQSGGSIIKEKAQEAHPRLLLGLWVALLQDWLVFSSQPPLVQAAYTPRLFAALDSSGLATVKPFLQQAWAPALAAACSMLGEAHEVDDEGRVEKGAINPDDYLLLLEACEMVICCAANAKTHKEIASEDLTVALAGLTCLLETKFLTDSLCSIQLCCESLVLVTGLVQQAGVSDSALLAATQVARQVSQAAPPQYVEDASLVNTVAAAILACLKASGAAEQGERPGCPAAARTALEAAGHLLSRAGDEGAVFAMPWLVIKGVTVLKMATQDEVLAAAANFLLELARQAAEISDRGVSTHVDILAYSAMGASAALLQFPHETAPTNESRSIMLRFEATLNLVLAVGGLLPSHSILPGLPDLSQPPPAPTHKVAAWVGKPDGAVGGEPGWRSEGLSEGDDWGDEEGFQEAESFDDEGWADGGFQEGQTDEASLPALQLADDGAPASEQIRDQPSPRADSGGSLGSQDCVAAPGRADRLEEDSREGHTPAEGTSAYRDQIAKKSGAEGDSASNADLQRVASFTELNDNRASSLGHCNGKETGSHASEEVADTRHVSPKQPLNDSAVNLQIDCDSSTKEPPSHTNDPPAAALFRCGTDALLGSPESSSPDPRAAPIAHHSDSVLLSESSDQSKIQLEHVQSGLEEQTAESTAAPEADAESESVGTDCQVVGNEERRVSLNGSSQALSLLQNEEADDGEEWGEEFQEASAELAALPPEAQAGVTPDKKCESGGAATSTENEPRASTTQEGTTARGRDADSAGQSLESSTGQDNNDKPATLQEGSAAETTSSAGLDGDPCVPEDLQKSRESCLHALRSCMEGDAGLPIQTKVLHAVRALAQEASSASCSTSRAKRWALACLQTVAPVAATKLQHEMQSTKEAALSPALVLMASETLKLLNSSLPLSALAGSQSERECMGLLVQLLVVCAGTEGSDETCSALTELVTKLMAVLAAGPSGAAFRNILTALPLPSRQRLQAAFKDQPANQSGRTAGGNRPTITLKTFAPLKLPHSS